MKTSFSLVEMENKKQEKKSENKKKEKRILSFSQFPHFQPNHCLPYCKLNPLWHSPVNFPHKSQQSATLQKAHQKKFYLSPTQKTREGIRKKSFNSKENITGREREKSLPDHRPTIAAQPKLSHHLVPPVATRPHRAPCRQHTPIIAAPSKTDGTPRATNSRRLQTVPTVAWPPRAGDAT